MQVVFNDRRRTGRLDLESVEMAMRSAMHHAGAAAISKLLRFEAPSTTQRTLACPCGQHAHYRELRAKKILTAVGSVEVSRPYFRCPPCHHGQFPTDIELDVKDTGISPGVRRMLALVGQQAPFDQGRQQMKLLAGLEVNTKAVERTAEAIGDDIAVGERERIQQAMELNLPIIVGWRFHSNSVHATGRNWSARRQEGNRWPKRQD